MAEEATPQQQEEGQKVFSSQDMAETDKIGEEGPVKAEYQPLFDDEALGVGDLEDEGQNAQEDGKSADEPKEDIKDDGDKALDPDKEKTATDQPKDGKKPESKEDQPDGKKPQEKMVPHGALHEERMKRQALATENQTLRTQLAAKKTGLPANGEGTVPKDFKVLEEEAFEELASDDPSAAVIYQRHLQVHLQAKTAKAIQAQAENDTIERSIVEMKRIVPGLFDEDDGVNENLTQFAVESGLDDQAIVTMITNPHTRIVVEDGSTQILGERAARVVAFLNNAFQQSKKGGVDEAALRKTIEAEVTAKVTADLMKKFKTTPDGGDAHTSLGDVPGDSGQDLEMRDINEGGYGKLSTDDQRRWLGG